MKTYIGTKTVKAEPCILGNFVKLTGRNPYENDTKAHCDSEEGYLVEYSDEYKSWSPKAVFEAAYKCAESFMDRLFIEVNDLQDKIIKLSAFIGTENFYKLDDENRAMLNVQYYNMLQYIKVLNNRIEYLKNNDSDIVLTSMNFGMTITALILGHAVRRKGWNGKNIYVVKQVPQSIPSDVIPKMNSLPQSAKDKILAGIGHIDYMSQCLIINEITGRADSWVPSISDVFADDWEIYW